MKSMKEQICVFGVGSYYSSKKQTIVDKYEIVTYIDNRVPSGKKEFCDGKTVYNPEDWLKIGAELKVVLMAADWFGMWLQLKSYNFSSDQIILAYDIKPFYDRTEEIIAENSISFKLCDKWISVECDGKESIIKNKNEYKIYLDSLVHKVDYMVDAIANMSMFPSSSRFGLERGKPIDRVFIEKFIERNKKFIRGTVIEIGDDRYMKQYSEYIDDPKIMHVNGWGGMKGNLATGEGIIEDYADCLICTQTLQHIYDLRSCIHNIYKLLKPGGTALITNGCIGELSLYDYHNWGEYWKFTDMAASKLFSECFDSKNVEVTTYGNVKAAIAFLYGLCAEEVPNETFEYQDEQYPMVVTIRAIK